MIAQLAVLVGLLVGRCRARVLAAWNWTARYCAPVLGPVAARAGVAWSVLAIRVAFLWRRAVRPLWRRLWRAVEQPLRDAGGWLVHTLPPLAARTTLTLSARFARWLPGALWRTLTYAAIGAGVAARHTGRYCLAYRDFAARIRHAEHDGKPNRAARLRQRWRSTALRRTLLVLATLGALVWSTGAAASARGPGVLWLAVVVVVGGLAAVGRIARPPRPPAEPDPAVAMTRDGSPFPLADAHTRAEAAEAATRALAAEGIELRGVGEVRRTCWGWEVGVMLLRGTPALITGKTAELETHLDLPAGGALVTPDRARRAHVTLRLAESDPFAAAPAAPDRPPLSATIAERAVIGSRIDGLDLEAPLLGVHGVVIGAPGAGKSTTLAAIADAVTACRDAVVWDLDPGGLGLGALGDAVGRRALDRDDCEEALADALALAETRPQLLGKLGMGDAWTPAPARPALVVIVDEYPRLSDRAKELAVALLRIGRKARVTLILAATEATSDALGASIAELAGLKVLHSCRSTDVRLVLGSTMGAEGWRPDRLHPSTGDDPGDVGKCYVSTAGLREPLIAKVHRHEAAALAVRATARARAGVPLIDAGSWQGVRTRQAGQRLRDGDADDGAKMIDHWAVTDIVAAFGDDRRLWTEEIRARLADRDAERYSTWTADMVAATLRPLGVPAVQIKRDALNRRGYDRDAIQAAYRDRTGRP